MMKKFICTLLLGLPLFASAESSVSFYLDDIPSRCNARVIIAEVPILSDSNFNLGEVLDVTDVREVSSTRNRLVCKARFKTDVAALNGIYQISFSKNSMGSIIVDHRRSY